MHHAAGLKVLLREEGKGRETTVVPKGGKRELVLEACSERERAIIAFALKLTKSPTDVG